MTWRTSHVCSQDIGIGRAPAVCLNIALTTPVLCTHEQDELWLGTCPARSGLHYATGEVSLIQKKHKFGTCSSVLISKVQDFPLREI